MPAAFLGGDILGLTRDVLMLSSWAFNALLAEVLIRARTARLISPGRPRSPCGDG